MSGLKYDYLIVGAGLFGSVFAHLMNAKGNSCLVIDRRSHIGGNCYSENIEGIEVHKYGPHIFHTKDKEIWDFVNQFGEFNRYTHRAKANYNGNLYSFPINLETYKEVYGFTNPQAAKKHGTPYGIYEMFYLGYSRKIWGESLENISKDVLNRIPRRYNFNDSYYEYNEHQGIPVKGYTDLIQKMLRGTDVMLNTDYFENKKEFYERANKIVYTGSVDELLDFRYGELPYRGLCFKETKKNVDDFQGIAQINYTDSTIPYLRTIEHKHFMFNYQHDYSIVTYEYPEKHADELNLPVVKCYPVYSEANRALYKKYYDDINHEKHIIGGRLGEYRYMNMDETIKSAIEKAENEI